MMTKNAIMHQFKKKRKNQYFMIKLLREKLLTDYFKKDFNIQHHYYYFIGAVYTVLSIILGSLRVLDLKDF